MPTVVTVTYGNRWPLLRQLLQELRRQGVKDVIVVDNGSVPPIEAVAEQFCDMVKIIRLPVNVGSAGGFSAGIVFALERGAKYILLLDDDNLPASDCIEKLMEHLNRVSHHHSPSLLAVQANRYGRECDFAREIPSEVTCPHPASFMGFHIFDLPAKIRRRFRKGIAKEKDGQAPSLTRICVATYGGLLFHRSLIERIGLPRDDFVVYVDDYELTSRITSAGGSIWLAMDAGLRDLEMQWNAGQRFRTAFEAWLMGESDLRAYYTARNRVYFESHLQPHQSWMRLVNKFFFQAILGGFAWKSGKRSRLNLLSRAITDGEQGRLGMNPEYPL